MPWLFPFAPAPSPAVLPWLFAMGCGAGLLMLRAPLQPRQILLGWWLAAAVSAAMGLLQYAGAADGLSPWIVPAELGEAYGNLRQRNQFATLCNMGLAALVYHVVLRRPQMGLLQGGAFTLVALLMAANAASSSRTGLLQLALTSGLLYHWGLLRQEMPRRMVVMAWLSYGLAAWLLPTLLGLSAMDHGILHRLRDGGPPCDNRLTLWANVWHLIEARPWTGWGWGELDYAHFMTLYPGQRFCEILDNAHNLPLHLAVEHGLPIALLLCLGLLWWVWRRAPWREMEPGRQAAWAVLSIICVHSLLEYPLWYGPFQIAVVLCISLLASPAPAALPERRRAGMAVGRPAAALLTLAALTYAAWDYHRVRQIYLPAEQRAEPYRKNTLDQIRGSWLFRDQVLFAEYNLTPLTSLTAGPLHAMGLELLHYSPEAAVVEKLIETARMLGRDEEVTFYRVRYKAAYPKDYQQWVSRQVLTN